MTKELVFGLMSSKNGDSGDTYRIFTEIALGNDLENPIENVYGGMILGRSYFIKDVLIRIKEKFYLSVILSDQVFASAEL